MSPDTAHWCARKRYPYIALATRLEPTVELWDFYAKAAAQEGYQAGPENFGYLQPVVVADTQERAEELGKRILFGGAFAHFARPEWMFPPGYNSKAATRRLAQPRELRRQCRDQASARRGSATRPKPKSKPSSRTIYDELPDCASRITVMIAGTPDNVIPRLNKVLEVLRPGIFSFWLDGPVPAKDRLRCLELLNRDVIPAMREHGQKDRTGRPVPSHSRLAPAALGDRARAGERYGGTRRDVRLRCAKARVR